MKARIAFAALLALDVLSRPRSPLRLRPMRRRQRPAAVDEASQRFKKGVQLFKEWSFDAALAEFRKAYQLAPSYRVLYNIAQVHYELHNYVEALKAFRQYLTEGGSESRTTGGRRSKPRYASSKGGSGTSRSSANVDSGQVSVDDVPVGTSRCKAPILVNPGVRRVSVTKTGLRHDRAQRDYRRRRPRAGSARAQRSGGIASTARRGG